SDRVVRRRRIAKAAGASASRGEPVHAAGESTTTQAAAVNVQESTNSLHWKALGLPATAMGIQTRSVNNPICHAETEAASRANTPTTTATPAAMKAHPVKYAQPVCQGSQAGTSTT